MLVIRHHVIHTNIDHKGQSLRMNEQEWLSRAAVFAKFNTHAEGNPSQKC